MGRMKLMLLLRSLNAREGEERETIIGIFKYAYDFLCMHEVCVYERRGGVCGGSDKPPVSRSEPILPPVRQALSVNLEFSSRLDRLTRKSRDLPSSSDLNQLFCLACLPGS